MRSVFHIRRHIRKSSFVAFSDPRYASIGTSSQPGALSMRSASRHILSSSSPSSSYFAVRYSKDLFLSASGLAHFTPKNVNHSSSSLPYVTSRLPLRSLDGLTSRDSRLPDIRCTSPWTLLHCYRPDKMTAMCNMIAHNMSRNYRYIRGLSIKLSYQRSMFTKPLQATAIEHINDVQQCA